VEGGSRVETVGQQVQALGDAVAPRAGLDVGLGRAGDALADEVAADLLVKEYLVVHGDLLVVVALLLWMVIDLLSIRLRGARCRR
jgi:hypothetical protein